MLNLHFINVADGDAILIEEQDGSHVFRMMVDTGRNKLEHVPGSRRCLAAAYLRERNISHLDMVVITHLHADHSGGLSSFLPEITIEHVYSGFFPGSSGMRIPPEPNGQKTVCGLIECVNQWAADVERLQEAGCRLHTVSSTLQNVPLTQTLTADLICPNPTENAVQRLVWNAMLQGKPVPEDLKYWASKSRNPGSLRLRLRYAGRSLLLAGDCYGYVWENEDIQPCDILKVPHHGDGKAMTEKLAARLRPRYAVISCGAEYIPHKDRPSQSVVEQLQRCGTEVWFTDSFAAPWHQAKAWSSVDFTILEDGVILTPNGRTNGGR